MVKVTNKHTYAEIDDALEGEITVYVDASFSSAPVTGRRSLIPFASGWAISGENEVLKGYGVSLIWDDYAKDSAVAELRAILSFLDTIDGNFPALLSKSNRFNIRCDNQALMRDLTNGGKHEDISRKVAEKYGRDYLRIVYYMTKTNFNFAWVRGHSDNPFNCLADKIAHQCWSRALTEEGFDGKNREEYVKMRLGLADLQVRQNTAKARFENPSARKEKVALYCAYHTIRSDGEMTAGFSYVNKNTKENSYDAEKVTGFSKMAVQMRGLSYALFNYRISESFDIDNPVVLRVDMVAVIGLVKALLRGQKPDIKLNDEIAKRELENLKVLLTGMSVTIKADSSQDIATVKSIAYIACEDHGTVDFESTVHRGRITKRLAKI